jgi:hypothetical protein
MKYSMIGAFSIIILTYSQAIAADRGAILGDATGSKVSGRDSAIDGGGKSAAVRAETATDGKVHGSRHSAQHWSGDYDSYDRVKVEYGHHYNTQPSISHDHMPPPGLCRVWYPHRTPGLQPPPGDCRALKHRQPAGTWLVQW